MAADTLKFMQNATVKVLGLCWSYKKIVLVVAGGVGYHALRRYFGGGVCHSRARLDGKTVLITGANCGIGRETARDLAGRGARVILACRDVTKAERAADDIRKNTGNPEVVVRVVDLASLESVRKFAREVTEKEKRLDVLINNAGVMFCPYWKSQEGYEMQFAVNHLGHFLLTNLLLDLLKKSAPSRIICVSSLAHRRGRINFEDINMEQHYDSLMAYGQSKLANVLFARELARRLQGTEVTANSLHPGVVKTELGRHLSVMGVSWFKQTLFKVASLIFIKTPVQGAQTTIFCAVDESLNDVSGKYFSDCAEKGTAAQGQDDEVAKQLWDLSCKMVNLPAL
ncbi:retinol dehydrogenase 12-like [Haliotis rufescens]|uniref:retinol dehydrogenase 12-like n=1 Tax=Haliotis rufescens TaxID=6454 RepID=UPI001EAF8FA3|nr:retinol dehydrogenase 12-like [Haliotis rufescens]